MEKRTFSRLKEKEREDRKDLILDAAEKLFATKPYDKVSLQEIANEAGLAKSSIYTYFSTQEDLFVEAGMRDAGSLFLEWEAILNKKGKSCLEKMINTWIDFFISHESFYRMSAQFMLYGKMSLEAIDKLNPITRRMLDTLELAIRHLDYKGDSRLLAHTLFSALIGILIAYRKYPGRSEEEIRKHMKRIGKNIKEMTEVFISSSRI
jgi:AcrR family transcriptional regulator